jgi:AcrR family transcriptional regulator
MFNDRRRSILAPLPMSPEEIGRRDRKRQQTLDHLASIARRLFERNGFDAVTMEQIAAEADLAKGTLYNHFPTKEAVLAYVIHQELGQDLGKLGGLLGPDSEFATGVTVVMDAHAHWCEAHRDYLAPYLRFRFMDIQAPAPDTGSNDSSDVVDVYAALIANSQRAGKLRNDLDARHLAVLFHHLCLGALLRWLMESNLELRRELAVAVDLFLTGAATTRQRGSHG